LSISLKAVGFFILWYNKINQANYHFCMFKHNFLTYGAKVSLQIVWEFLYFPIWWYTVGFWRWSKKILEFWHNQEASLGFLVWVKNIFVPMYGQHDFAGRMISFVIRVIQIIYRGLAMLVVLVIGLLALAVWLLFPVGLLVAIVLQFL